MKNLSKYQQVSFEEKSNVLVFKWLPATEKMTTEEFVEDIKIAAKTMMQYKECKVLLLSQDMRFVISPDIQEKANEILLPAYSDAGVKKLAIIVPLELVSEMSLEQTVEENQDKHAFRTHFFADEKSAREWIIE